MEQSSFLPQIGFRSKSDSNLLTPRIYRSAVFANRYSSCSLFTFTFETIGSVQLRDYLLIKMYFAQSSIAKTSNNQQLNTKHECR